MDQMYQIAAAHGRGVGALIDRALNPFAEQMESEQAQLEDLTNEEIQKKSS